MVPQRSAMSNGSIAGAIVPHPGRSAAVPCNDEGPPSPAGLPIVGAPAFLDLDLGALLLERGLDLLGLVAGNAFLDRLRRGVDEVLGLLEAQTGQLTHDLDHGDL